MSISALSQQTYRNVYLALGGSAAAANGGVNCARATNTSAAATSAAASATTSSSAASTPSATSSTDGGQSSGLHLFFSAVLEAFARITGTAADSPNASTPPAETGSSSAGSAASPASPSSAGVSGATGATSGADEADSTQMRAQEKIRFELQVQDNGDIALDLKVDAKVKVSGGSAASNAQNASDLMKALQDFTANLFAALQSMVSGLLTGNGASTTPAAPGTPAGTSSTPLSPAASGTTASTAVTPAASNDTPAAPTSATNVAATAPATPATTPSTTPRLPSLYVSLEFKLRSLIDDVTRADRNDPTLPKERHARVHHLREHFNKVSNAMPTSAATASSTGNVMPATGSGAKSPAASAPSNTAPAPSLVDFLNQLTIAPAGAASFAYSVRAGALLNVQA